MEFYKKLKKSKRKNHGSSNTTKKKKAEEISNLSENIDLASAYVKSIMDRKNKKKKLVEVEVDRSWILNTNIPCDPAPDLSGFTVVHKPHKIKREAHKVTRTAESYGKKAYNLILQNEKLVASEFLTKAADLDPHDFRHYYNRSFCYLCTGEFKKYTKKNPQQKCCNELYRDSNCSLVKFSGCMKRPLGLSEMNLDPCTVKKISEK